MATGAKEDDKELEDLKETKNDDKAWDDLKSACKEVVELKEKLLQAETQAASAASDAAACTREGTDPGKEMLAVGSVYEGDIAIPGIAQSLDSSDSEGENSSLQGRQIYTLEVLRSEVDELGQPCLLGKHAAYGDEQLCHLLVSADGSTLSYADGETQCSGVMDLQARSIAGKVCQLLPGEEGFYAHATEVTHTFRLALARSSAAERQARAALTAARHRRLALLVQCIVQPGVMGREKEEALGALELASAEILEDVVDSAEATCALFRRQAALLQGSKFETLAQREQTMASLAAKIGLIDRQGSNRPDLIQDKLMSACLKAHQRLGISFHRLDKALQSAEQRLAQEVLAGCMICLLELEEREAVLRLPCKHMFHHQCGTEWLHTHTTCPNCRREVGKEAEEAAQRAAQGEHGQAGGGEGETDREGCAGEARAAGVEEKEEGRSASGGGAMSSEEAVAREEAQQEEEEEGKDRGEAGAAAGAAVPEEENVLEKAVGWVRGLFG